MADITQLSTGFFAGASDRLKQLLQSVGHERQLATGDILMEQEAPGDTLYLVMEGALEVSVLSIDGRKLSLYVAHAGDVLGEIALFDPGPRTATVTAREACSIWGIRNADVMTAVHRSPELAADLLLLAGRRMRWMGAQLGEQVFLPLPARLARKILHLTAHDDSANPILELSQLELAEFAGASREAVSKILSSWNGYGHIALKRKALHVLDRGAISKIAEITLF